MRTLLAISLVLVVTASSSAVAETARLERVVVEAGRSEVRVPGMVGVTMRILDGQGSSIPIQRLSETLDVRLTLNGAPVVTELWTRESGSIIETDLTIRHSGMHHVGARVQEVETGIVVAESEPVAITAVAPLDYGVVRAGETVCRELPGGGRGLLGEVVEGELPQNLRLWGACLVAGDSVEDHQGGFRGAVAVLSGSGQGRRVDRRLYDITYNLEPRLFTPRRVFYGFLLIAVLAMLAIVGFAVRSRFPVFGPGTALAFTRIAGTPYRGERAVEWQFVDLTDLGKRRGAVDVAFLIGAESIDSGVLSVRPTGDGLVEFIGPKGEEIHAMTPESNHEVGHRRLRVPYGSTVTFRDVALSPMLLD